jgi:hypothetical protein
VDKPKLPLSLFDRVISRPRSPWVTLAVVVLLYAAALAVTYAEVGMDALFAEEYWRIRLFPPTIITYILLVSPALGRMSEEVLDAFRSLLAIDEDEFVRLIHQTATIPRHSEWIAIAIGVTIGAAPLLISMTANPAWLTVYQALSGGATNALLAWVAYVSVADTRWITVLLRQPLRFHPLDPSPFQAVGRQSLVLALTFVGGISLSLLFILSQPGATLSSLYWLPNIPLALVPVIVFYLNMHPTHRVLLAAKKAELKKVRRRMAEAYEQMPPAMDSRHNLLGTSIALDALVAYERRLSAASTWPYNTEMLRTLLASVLLPLGVTFLRSLIDLLLN